MTLNYSVTAWRRCEM